MTTAVPRSLDAARERAPSYKAPARLLHWLTAVLVLSLLLAGQVMVMEGIPRPLQDLLFIFHKSVGVLVLLLMLVRLLYRWRHPAPPLPPSVPPAQARIAGATHWLLYALLLVQAVSGYVRVKAGGFPIESLDAMGVPSLVPRSDALAAVAKEVHWWTRLALAGLITLHVGAAVLHGLVLRDGVFQRMWPRRSR